MGLEFIRKAAPAFRKGLDRSRIALATPKLFMQEPTSTPRTYAATLRDGAQLLPGEFVGVRLNGEQVIAQCGLTPIATFTSPTRELMNALRDSFGEACGRVQEVHEIAGIAEISVC